MNWDFTTTTPLWTRWWRSSKSTKTSALPQLHNTLPNSRPPTRPTPWWSHRCRIYPPKSRPYSSPTPPTMEEIMAAAADAAPVGAADVHDRQPRPPQSTFGTTVTANTAAKNKHTLLIDRRRRCPLPTRWAAVPIGAKTSPNDRYVQ